MTSVKVFISYSPADREVAARLDHVLREHKAATFINEERHKGVDVLRERLREGIDWCSKFLLLWSINAARSTWVSEQWNQACSQSKRILPYLLDCCPLPDVLDGDVFIAGDDQHRGHGQLLSAMFGEDLAGPDPSEMFRGAWCATLAIDGLVEATHDLKLYANGQIIGKGLIGQSGKLADLMRQMGMVHLLNLEFPVRGEWTYKDFARTLTLDFTLAGLGVNRREIIQVVITGKERYTLRGEDDQGRTWIVERPLGINTGREPGSRLIPTGFSAK
jgi:TIR domain